jgi:hypothetical protein
LIGDNIFFTKEISPRALYKYSFYESLRGAQFKVPLNSLNLDTIKSDKHDLELKDKGDYILVSELKTLLNRKNAGFIYNLTKAPLGSSSRVYTYSPTEVGFTVLG